jgi:hypothetical protein
MKTVQRCAPRIMMGLCLGLSSASIYPVAAVAQDEVDPEWPCIQRLIMEVSPAVMWPLPIEESMQTSWRKDPVVRKLAEKLGALEQFDDAARADISAFADTVPDGEKETRLSLLATGVVAVTNRERKQFIRGIKRYTRQQIAIAEQIENSLNQLSLLESESELDQRQREELQEVEETLRWHERVYDQRERAIISLCEEPVELEQKLSDTLRDVAQYLP